MSKILTAPLTPISWGELIDKITILEIKQINITSATALGNVNKELDYLNDILNNNSEIIERISNLKEQLLVINKSLWQIEDDIREKDLKQEFDNTFIELARKVYRLNDPRANLKKSINQVLNSELLEEKSYKNFHN
jgi:predicted  nucleic acid-binding Zn-ribbon protein